MPTVSTYLKMFDQFSRPLQQVSNGVQGALSAMERLKRVVEAPVTMKIDTSKAAEAITRTQAQLAGASGKSAIQIAIDSQSVAQDLNAIRQRLQNGLTSAAVQVGLNAQEALQTAPLVRDRIAAALGTVDVTVQLTVPGSVPAIHVPTLDIPLQLDTAGAGTQWQTFRERLLTEGLPTLTLQLDIEKTVSAIARAREKIGQGGSQAIELVLNVQDIMRKVSDVKQQIKSTLSEAIVHVTLDKQQALAESDVLRQQIQSTLGQVELKANLAIPQAEELTSRLSQMLNGVSPIVTISLAFNHEAAYAQIQQVSGQLKQTSIAFTATLDASGALAEVERLKQRITAGTFSAIHVMLDAGSVTKVFQQIQQRMQSGTEQFMLEVTFNARQAVQKAQMLKKLLEKQLDGLKARIQLELPASVNMLFANLQRMMMKLTATTRRMTSTGEGSNKLESALQRIVALEKQIEQTQSRVNTKMHQAGGASSDWMGNLKSIAGAYLSIQGAQRLLQSTIGQAMEQQKMSDMFVARTGDEKIGTGMFDKFKAEALAAGQDVNKSLQSTLSFFSTTQNTDQLSKLNNLAQRMAAFDSAGNGIEGAAFALKEAMSGDIVSLAERFNMSKTDIRAFKIDDLGKSGNMDGFINAFDQLLEKQRMGQDAFDKMMASPAKQAEILGNNIKSSLADAGQSGMSALMPLITMLNTAFQEGKFQPFFDGLSAGLSLFANVATWAGQLILDNLDIVKNILLAVGIVALVVAAKFLIAWIMAAWPIILIIAAIAGIITMLNHFGISTADIIGFVVGLFMMLVASIWNVIALIWNVILGFAEFLFNIFVDPVYAIKKLFYDLAMAFGDQVYNMVRSAEEFAGGFTKMIVEAINGVLKGFNWLSDKVKDLFGLDMGQAKLFDEENVHAMSDAVKSLMDQLEEPTSDKDVFDFSDAKMDPLNYKDMFDTGFDFGKDAFNGASDALSKATDFSSWNTQTDQNRNIDKVGEVGKIKDTVDISSEDLKTMRELAEMKNIQNFVTLQPQLTFGDTNIRQDGRSVDEIVSNIAERMEQEIAASARGVYGV